MRKTELRRKAPMTRKPMKRRGPSKSEDLRKRGTSEFRLHVLSSPCLWCGVTRPISQAHFGKHPMGKKNDWTRSGPLCEAFDVGDYRYPGCHSRLDRREVTPQHPWFTAEERHTLELRQQAFMQSWMDRSGE